MVAGEAVHRNDLDSVPKHLIPCTKPRAEHGGRTARNHIEQPGRTGTVDHRGQVHDHGHEVRITLPSYVFPLMLVHAEDPHPVEVSGLVVCQFADRGQGEGVDHVPAPVQRLRHRGHRHLVEGQALENPAGSTAGGRGFRCGDSADALAEYRHRTGVVVAGEPW